MKKYSIIVLFLLVVSFFFSSVSFSAPRQETDETNVTIDLTKLSPQTRNEILNIKSRSVVEKVSSPELTKDWINVGKEIGNAVNEMVKALNTNINEFAQTPVGRTAMFLLVYKLIGKEIISKSICLIIYGIVVILVIWSFRKFHLNERNERIIKEDGVDTKQVLYIEKYHFKTDEAKIWSAFFHCLIFAVFSLVIMLIV